MAGSTGHSGGGDILLNGKAFPVRRGDTVASLLSELALAGRFAIEINGQIVSASRFPGRRLKPGDRVEIVQAVGGG
ncbi:MAG: sulfur carrier protein ThiS [Gammaproteobacteria bacterium]|nr:sulfur carrier protein ThiS [Gammaproteobacteria bacterium]MDD9824419.1 sulfur carrier protein ThiS [Gammaproteobacteria bacterium]MDD9864604.1 sulfur carrier protein ThiS [Gammaproteobacteria bacterium]